MLTVVERAKSRRLVTIEDARLDMGLDDETFPDTRLSRLIDQVSGDVATYCQRAFGRQIYRQTIMSMPREGVALIGPVNRIVNIGLSGGAGLGTDDYRIEDGTLKLTYGEGAPARGDGTAWNLWRSLQPAITIVYEAGWLLPGEDVGALFTGQDPLPAEIEKAVVKLIGVAVSEAGRDPTIKQDTVEGVGSTSFYVQGAMAGLPHPGAEATLSPYRWLTLV